MIQDVWLVSGERAPAFLVYCAVVPYLEQYKEAPKHIGNYDIDYYAVELVPDADEAAGFLDRASLQDALYKMALKTSAPESWLLPFGRYASPEQVTELLANN